MRMDVIGLPEKPNFIELPPSGLEQPLTEMQTQIVETVRAFANEVMRPIGTALDKLTPDEVIAPNSPFWDFYRQYAELGINVTTITQIPKEELEVLFPLLWEELGAADSGLAISLAAGMLPHLMSKVWGRDDLFNRFPETQIGCWGITEPDHGSDILDSLGDTFYPGGRRTKPNLVATLKGDKYILNGQKSAWVSNGPVAQHSILFCACDRGLGPDEGIVLLLPLDLKGISRGKPLNKLGKRALPQGEIFFNNVEVPKEFVLMQPEQYDDAVYAILAEANVVVGSIATGIARTAYHQALEYAHTRKQGGAPIIRHQSVQIRLMNMFRMVEMSRALCRRVYTYNTTAPVPALQGSIAAKVTATRAAFDVADMALQIHGGNGLTKEYPMEKLLRDARAGLIEDGCNETLTIKGGTRLINPSLL